MPECSQKSDVAWPEEYLHLRDTLRTSWDRLVRYELWLDADPEKPSPVILKGSQWHQEGDHGTYVTVEAVQGALVTFREPYGHVFGWKVSDFLREFTQYWPSSAYQRMDEGVL